MKAPWRILGLLVGVLSLAAQDDAAMMRELGALERKTAGELRQVEQRFAKERVLLNSTTRQKVSAAERAVQAQTTAALAKMTAHAGLGGAGDLGQLADAATAIFDKAEIEAELEYGLLPQLDARERLERAAIERRRDAEAAKVQARYLAAGEETGQMRQMIERTSAIELRWREQLDQLDYERDVALAKVQREIRTAENAFTRDQTAAMMRRTAAATEGGEGLNVFATMGDPAMQALQVKRDDEVNALMTKLDELNADFDAKRADLEAGRDDEIAQANDA